MIVDLARFIAEERPKWERLDAMLRHIAADPWRTLSMGEVRELELLYQRASADLARLATFAAEAETRRYLENLVARAFTEVHGMHAEQRRFQPWVWFTRNLPQAFRRRIRAFFFACGLTVAGMVFGGLALACDPAAKAVIMPFSNLMQSPRERVAEEESAKEDRLKGKKATFAGMLMTHNTRVTFSVIALGLTWGIGTLLLIFYNGVILGAVAMDYMLDGQTVFLLGWLLPHGVAEIPAILIGGQAGFVLAGALLGRGENKRLADRMRAVAPDVVTLAFGAALLLVWAGLVEAFISQYHKPVLPYAVKIAFGVAELFVLCWFLARAGRNHENAPAAKREAPR
jgi:uncharacterized membrane protein SpoIIM required for sporulation